MILSITEIAVCAHRGIQNPLRDVQIRHNANGMQFDQPFIRLPIRFDADALEREVNALPPEAWVPHPTGFVGNEAVRLITVAGEPTDACEGPMGPTENLALMPYVQQLMAELDGVWTRSRLMGLGPGGEVPLHVDAHYHWRTHLRIHIPVITDPKVLFTCGDRTVHMAAGECWLFDSFRQHRVENGWTKRRVHLVLDTVMTESLRALIDSAHKNPIEPRFVAPRQAGPTELRFEQFNAPEVMSPWEIRCHIEFIFSHAFDHPRAALVRDRMERFADSWAAAWAEMGPSMEAVPTYRRLLAECRFDTKQMASREVVLDNGLLVGHVLESMIYAPALAARLAGEAPMQAAQRQRVAS